MRDIFSSPLLTATLTNVLHVVFSLNMFPLNSPVIRQFFYKILIIHHFYAIMRIKITAFRFKQFPRTHTNAIYDELQLVMQPEAKGFFVVVHQTTRKTRQHANTICPRQPLKESARVWRIELNINLIQVGN